MGTIEQKIKDFAKSQGIEVVGVAGPEKLDGPPSMDPTYTMWGAKSIVSFAIPMDVDAIYDFLGKKTQVTHNLDQLEGNQRVQRLSHRMADYIKTLGYRAKPVPANNSYRRDPDVFATHPSFSHRFGAIASGIGAQGWSGNLMTKEYGASIYLGTVVTSAKLTSDKPYPARYFVDNYCVKCKLCDKTCTAGMFDAHDEEQVLVNKELHPRAKRHNLDLCNAACFGLHSLSRDKKWSTWGRHMIGKWIETEPDKTDTKKMRKTLMVKGAVSGDATPRFQFIRAIGKPLLDKKLIKEYTKNVRNASSQDERNSLIKEFGKKIGVKGNLNNDTIITCGQCALVCGPTLEECQSRYKALIEGGIVVPGENGEMVRVDTWEEAEAIRARYPFRISRPEMLKDGKASASMWFWSYWGIEPKSIVQGWIYKWKMKRALKKAA